MEGMKDDSLKIEVNIGAGSVTPRGKGDLSRCQCSRVTVIGELFLMNMLSFGLARISISS